MAPPHHSMKLEPFGEVLKRQVPVEIGRPIPMIVYSLDHPKNCGDPWIGAYSKHGFWYKFSDGTNDDYQRVVARAYDSDSYKLDYDSLRAWRAVATCGCRFIVAKNQSDELLGSIAIFSVNDFTVIGIYYVIEECRHSAIGSKLFNEALRNVNYKQTIIFHSMSNLASKCYRFGFTESFEQKWKFVKYKISNPSGFPTLQNKEIKVIKHSNLSEAEVLALLQYDERVTDVKRSIWLEEWLRRENFDSYVAFKENEVIGYGCSRETAGGFVPPVVVGPLYANDFPTASALLHASLEKYYNPDEDYDWDPDIFAIYRRDVHFVVSEENTQVVALMELLKGEIGKLSKDRLHHVTQTTGNLPNADFSKIFAVSDMHLSVI